MFYRAVMFDLDGTLADTLADIAAAGNHMLAQLGRPALEVSRYRYLAGQGAPWLVEHALGTSDPDLIARGLTIFKAYQLEHGLDHTAPYEGMPALLDELTRRRLKLAVLSNKSEAATQVAVSQVLGRWTWAAIRGHRPGGPLKPEAEAALQIAAELGLPPTQWLYVGDTRVDMLTARAAGMFAVGVLWGFREEAELRESGAQTLIRAPGELLGLLG